MFPCLPSGLDKETLNLPETYQTFKQKFKNLKKIKDLLSKKSLLRVADQIKLI